MLLSLLYGLLYGKKYFYLKFICIAVGLLTLFLFIIPQFVDKKGMVIGYPSGAVVLLSFTAILIVPCIASLILDKTRIRGSTYWLLVLFAGICAMIIINQLGLLEYTFEPVLYDLKEAVEAIRTAIANACDEFISGGCEDNTTIVVQFDANNNGVVGDSGDSLQTLAKNYGGCDIFDNGCLRSFCGCPGFKS